MSLLMIRQETTLLAVVIAIAVLTGLKNPAFWSSGNMVEILRSSVMYFVMACGATVLVIGGGLDFSVGAVFTFGSLITGITLMHGCPWPLAVLTGLAARAGAGTANFLIVSFLHVPPIIATLGTFFVLLGVDNVITSGNDVLPLPSDFQTLGQGSTLGVYNDIWYAIIVGLISWFLLEHTRYGVNARALGGNAQAAIGNGLRVRRLTLLFYLGAGLTGALAGIIYTARVGAAQVEAGGASTTLVVLTAVLIGGVSLFGGLGSITGVAVGVVLLSLIDDALVLAHIPPDYNNIVIGAILVSAVALDHLRRQRLYKKR